MVAKKKDPFQMCGQLFEGPQGCFFGSLKIYRTGYDGIECRRCGGVKTLARLRREIAILQRFYQFVLVFRLGQVSAWT